MSGMTPERLQAIEDRLPGEVFPNSVEHDVLDLLDEVRRLRAIEVDIESTATGQQCTVKHTGVTIFKGVSLEATMTTEAHDRQVAARTLRAAASVFAKFAKAAPTDRARIGWESAHGALLGMADEREAGEQPR